MWRSLRVALLAQPPFADDALADLRTVTAGWEDAARQALLAAVARRALRGMPLPAALITALAEVLDD